MTQNAFKRHLITAALPYANGPVHIGHLAGCYLPADIYVRYLRSKGEDVVFICGSDEHGVPITIKAKQEGKQPQDVVDHYHRIMQEAFKEFGISFNHYSRTSSKPISLFLFMILLKIQINKKCQIFLKHYMIKTVFKYKKQNSILILKHNSF